MKDIVTIEPKNLTELRRAINSRQKRIDRKKLPPALAADATTAQIIEAINKIREALNA